MFDLIADDLGQPELADQEENRDDGEAEREFVGNHLGRGTNAAQEWIFGIGRPAGDDDPVNAQRRDREDKQHPDVDIGDDHRHAEKRAAERDDGERGDRGNHGKAGREPVVEFVYVPRREIFFQEKFRGVGDRLKKPAGPTRFGPSRSWIKALIRRSA